MNASRAMEHLHAAHTPVVRSCLSDRVRLPCARVQKGRAMGCSLEGGVGAPSPQIVGDSATTATACIDPHDRHSLDLGGCIRPQHCLHMVDKRSNGRAGWGTY